MIVPYLKLLKGRNFFPLCLGQIVSQFGDKLTQLACVALIGTFFKTNANLPLALLFAMTIVPIILFSPVTGVYVDRWSRRKTMFICDALRGLLVLFIPLFFLESRYFLLICVLIFFSSSVGRFFIPAKMAFLPDIVAKDKIFLANSLISVTATSAAILGIGFGGIIVDRMGLKSVFFIDAITFFISSICIFTISVTERNAFKAHDILDIGKRAVTTVKSSVLNELKEGLRYISTSNETRWAFRTLFFLLSYVGGLSTVYIRFIQITLGSSAQDVKDVSLTSLFLGVGVFIGSLIYGRFAHKWNIKKTLNISCFCAMGFLVFLVLLIQHYPFTLLAIVLSAMLGIIIAPIFIGVPSLIHKESSEEMLGRIFASLEFTTHLGFLLSMFLVATLADIFSKVLTPFTTMLSIGIIGFFCSLLFLLKDDYRT